MSYEDRYQEIRAALMRELDGSMEMSDEDIRERIGAHVLGVREEYLTIDERIRMERELFYSMRRLDVLQDLMDDSAVTEIMVNGPEHIFIEKNGRVTETGLRFTTPEKLDDVIRRIAGSVNRVIHERMPIVDARLPDGSRVNAVVAPAALDGPILTIRRFPAEAITMQKLIRLGSITEEAAEFLSLLTASGYSCVVSGGTSAGKTTFLNVLSAAIPGDERVITIEDNAELQIRSISNLVRLEAKNANMEDSVSVTIRDLIRAALRMRPDRILVGEIRGGEAVDMLQAFNTGHDGSMCTVHANSCGDTISRLETMTMMALPIPLPAIRRQIASGVDILVHLGRLKDHSRRVLEIAETDGIADGEVMLHPLYQWDTGKELLVRTGELRHTQKLERAGLFTSGSDRQL